MRPKELKELLIHSFKNNHSVLITGMPGVGKTDIFKQAVKKVKYDSLILHPAVDDPTDYKGLGGFTKDGKAEFKPYGNLRKLMKAKKPLAVLFDDLGQATEAVQKAIMQILLSHSINGKKVSKYVTFVAATNRRQDRAGVTGILEPVKSRFITIVELKAHIDDWCDWAYKHKMPSELISFLRWKPELLDDFQPTKDLTNSSIPRTIANIGKLINTKLPESLRFETFKGTAGEKFTRLFIAYLKVLHKLPTIKEIKKNPKTAPIPDEVSGKFAMMGIIVDNLTNDDMPAFLTYLDRLGSEITAATMKIASMKKPNECKNVAFINWSVKHQQDFKNIA